MNLNPLTHPDVIEAWRTYEAANTRAATDYYTRHAFREVRRDTERHLYRVAS